MPLTYNESLQQAISSHNSPAIVEALEPRVYAGEATEAECLLCGISLLMPPFADYEAASKIFSKILNGERYLEAAIWDAYRFAVLLPTGSQAFDGVLEFNKESSVAAHMRGMVAAANSDFALALQENRRSRSLRIFPFNAIEGLRRDVDLDASAKINLWRLAGDLMVSRAAERDAAPSTVEGALQCHWDNLILGTRITSYLWDDYCKIFDGFSLRNQ